MTIRRIIQNVLLFLNIDWPWETRYISHQNNNRESDINYEDLIYNDFVQWTD
jgi:hypothetical protein